MTLLDYIEMKKRTQHAIAPIAARAHPLPISFPTPPNISCVLQKRSFSRYYRTQAKDGLTLNLPAVTVWPSPMNASCGFKVPRVCQLKRATRNPAEKHLPRFARSLIQGSMEFPGICRASSNGASIEIEGRLTM